MSICYSKANVKIVGTHSGLTAATDGPTAQALEDISTTRVLPGLTVINPIDYWQALKATIAVGEYDGPVYLRISRASALPAYREGTPLTIGKGITLREGSDLTLVAIGSMVGRTLVAAENLAQKGVHARVLEIHTLKPLEISQWRVAHEEIAGFIAAITASSFWPVK